MMWSSHVRHHGWFILQHPKQNKTARPGVNASVSLNPQNLCKTECNGTYLVIPVLHISRWESETGESWKLRANQPGIQMPWQTLKRLSQTRWKVNLNTQFSSDLLYAMVHSHVHGHPHTHPQTKTSKQIIYLLTQSQEVLSYSPTLYHLRGGVRKFSLRTSLAIERF